MPQISVTCPCRKFTMDSKGGRGYDKTWDPGGASFKTHHTSKVSFGSVSKPCTPGEHQNSW